MEPEPEFLQKYVLKHFADYQVSVAYEAGRCGYYAHRCFISYGWRSLVVNPADIHRKGKEQFTKTDKIDAQLISRELKDGRLTSIVVPDVHREQLRSLFRRRNDLVKDCSTPFCTKTPMHLKPGFGLRLKPYVQQQEM